MAYKIWIYPERYDSIKELSLEDKGKILDNIFVYAIKWEIPHNWLIEVVFNFMKNRIETDKIAYEKRCELNKEYWILWGRPKTKLDNLYKPKITQRVLKKANSNSNSILLPNGNNNLTQDFDFFRKAYPLKKGKAEWYKAYLNAIKVAKPEVILASVKKYAEEREWKEAKYTKYAQGWLNSKRWEDEEAPVDITMEFATLTPKKFAEKYGYEKWSEMNDNLLLGQ